MYSEIIIGLIVFALTQGVLYFFGVFFAISKSYSKVITSIDMIDVKMQSLEKNLDLKLEAITKMNESLNVRISRLEQFRDDYYSSGYVNNLIPRRNEKTA